MNPEPTLIDFGYTSHSLSRCGGKHWDEVNIINMTGRLYDPYLARFLNADPYVSHPQSSQALNRYTYVNNNPLIYNDPTGEVWQMAVYLGWKYLKTAHDNRDRETGEWDWDLETFRAKNGDWSTFFYFFGDATMNFNGGFNIEGSFNVNGVPVVGVVYEPENTGIPQSEQYLAEQIYEGEQMAQSQGGNWWGSDYLEFTGTRSPGRTRVDGTLTWYRNTMFGSVAVDGWSARSGSRTLLPTPQGDWSLSNWRVRDKEGFVKDGVGFSVDITPDPQHGRRYLRIQPDGGLPGTAGCIGLTGGAADLQRFSNMITIFLQNNETMRLNVDYGLPLIQIYP